MNMTVVVVQLLHPRQKSNYILLSNYHRHLVNLNITLYHTNYYIPSAINYLVHLRRECSDAFPVLLQNLPKINMTLYFEY